MNKSLIQGNTFSKKLPFKYWPNLLFKIKYQGGLATFRKRVHWSFKKEETHRGHEYIPNRIKKVSE